MANPEMFRDNKVEGVTSKENNNGNGQKLDDNTWKRRNDIIRSQESENADLELKYQTVLLDLREKFPTIPEDLTNKSVTIRYQQDNGVYQNIILYSDGLVVTEINGKNIAINKINEERIGSANSESKNHLMISEIFSSSELDKGINEIIENADKCEIIVKKLDQPRLPVNE